MGATNEARARNHWHAGQVSQVARMRVPQAACAGTGNSMDGILKGKQMKNDIIEMTGVQHTSALAVAAPATPADIVLYAMQKGADIALFYA